MKYGHCPNCGEEDHLFKCHNCEKPTHVHELDAKPGDDGENFTVLECRSCYGPGFVGCAEQRGERHVTTDRIA